MKKCLCAKLFLIVAVTCISGLVVAQPGSDMYAVHVQRADSLYNVKEYRKSGAEYSKAFRSLGWKGNPTDRYNAACSWALAGVPDSAFFQLNRIATKSNYTNYAHITADTDLASLHKDKRWDAVLKLIKQNKEKAEANLNKPLAAKLDSIYTQDQKYRIQMNDIEKKYGWDSKEMEDLWKVINKKDSINLIKVEAILNQYGWLGADVVGAQGNSALFLVIQHSNLATQEKYLPMMREAVKKGAASGSSLALLEDRVLIGNKKRQLYGSQIGMNQKDGTHYVLPLDDPDHVDARRASVGLGKLSDYVKRWNIKWDVEQYKKDLPELEAKEKNRGY